MPLPRVLPYGAWPSPISVEMAVAGARSLSETSFDGPDLYWLEARPEEAGRVVLMRQRPSGSSTDVTPPGFNVRTRVHEYGGGAYTVAGGLVAFSNFDDGRLYLIRDGGAPEALTAAGALRYADLGADRRRERLMCVIEDHALDDHDPVNTLAAVSLRDGAVTTLVEGHDFFSDPRLDASGDRLCWLSWDRPNMPWDGCELWVAQLDEEGAVGGPRLAAGGPDESIVQPTWTPDGSLVFASDRSGWWNLYRWRDGEATLEPLAPMDAECAGPQWVFGLRTFGVQDDGGILLVAKKDGGDRLFALDGRSEPRPMALDAAEIAYLAVQGREATFVSGHPTRPSTVVRLDLASGAATDIHAAETLTVDPSYLSVPEHVEFPTEGGLTAFAYYYPPANPEVTAPADERPPLIVISHGGPTSDASVSLYMRLQFFTSRGFAVVDVDYGGSTGYGREYRRRLNDAWGIVDLDDCTNVAVWLADQGRADRSRLAIRGGSAGGYTTLCALAFRDVFACGSSLFGVGDLEALARDTHKFESRYLDYIVAPYPDRVDIYRERSPIHFVDRISCPVIVFQGADDKVVPQAQADLLVAALEANGLPYAYLLFQGEGHGFRRAENVRRCLEAELSFFGQVMGFEPADAVEHVQVEHLDRWRHERAARL